MSDIINRPRSTRATSMALLSLLLALLAFGVGVPSAPTVRAANLTVTTNADPDPSTGAVCPALVLPCSLRKAVEVANGDSNDVITVPNDHYVLTRGELSLSSPMTIQGGSTSGTIIDGNQNGRIFAVGTSASIFDITVTNGLVPGNTGGGGIQELSGPLTLTRVAVTNNTAPGNPSSPAGGGIFVEGSEINVIDSTISGNHLGSANSGNGFGSGLDIVFGGKLVMSGSTVSGNDSTAATGSLGAVALLGDSDPAQITNSTIADNTGVVGGANGIYNDGFDTNVLFSTIVHNTGQNVQKNGGTVTIKDTIVALATGKNCSGTVVDGGYNLESADDCGFTAANNSIINTDPMLGPLQDNGGHTATMLPGAGSPALDNASPDCPPAPSSDQRGVTRPQESACDIGAVEVAVTSTTSASPGSTTTPGLPASGTLPSTAGGPPQAQLPLGIAVLLVLCLIVVAVGRTVRVRSS
jgi:hypothetical protein